MTLLLVLNFLPTAQAGRNLVTGEDVTSRLQEALGSSSETETERGDGPCPGHGQKDSGD